MILQSFIVGLLNAIALKTINPDADVTDGKWWVAMLLVSFAPAVAASVAAILPAGARP